MSHTTALITKTNKVGLPIGNATPEALEPLVGTPVRGQRGQFVRYPYASYDLAARVKGEGPAWMAVCRRGNIKTAEALMGPDGIEKVAAARKTWCPKCGEIKKPPATQGDSHEH